MADEKKSKADVPSLFRINIEVGNLQKAADFLSPDQLASLGTFQTNMIGMERMGMNMKEKFLSGK